MAMAAARPAGPAPAIVIGRAPLFSLPFTCGEEAWAICSTRSARCGCRARGARAACSPQGLWSHRRLSPHRPTESVTFPSVGLSRPPDCRFSDSSRRCQSQRSVVASGISWASSQTTFHNGESKSIGSCPCVREWRRLFSFPPSSHKPGLFHFLTRTAFRSPYSLLTSVPPTGETHPRRRLAFDTTETELVAIAAAASIGLIRIPKNG